MDVGFDRMLKWLEESDLCFLYTGLHTQTFRNQVMKCVLLSPVLVADVSGHVPGKPLQWPDLAYHRYDVQLPSFSYLHSVVNL